MSRREPTECADAPDGVWAHPGAPAGGAAGPRFALLGPPAGWYDGQPLDLGRRQQRAFLAMLLARPGRVLTAAALADGVFEEGALPNRPAAVLATHAYRLRKELRGHAAGHLLVTVDDGYRFDVPARAVDLGVFDLLVGQADRALAAGRPPQARDLLARALALHRGEPLAGLPGRHAAEMREHLTLRRIAALETKLGLDVELGDSPSCLVDLGRAVFAHPFQERFRALLVLGLHRAGRPDEARAVHAEARRFYHDQGLDCAELDAVLDRIRRTAPASAPAGPSGPAHRPSAVPAQSPTPAQSPPPPPSLLPAPRHLPFGIADFTGRQSAVARLTALLAPPDPTAVAVVAVNGLGGVGKSTLALHVAHALRDRFPDGQLRLDLRGTLSDPLDPAEALADLLTALGVPDRAVPTDPAERAALYRTTLAGRRVLLLLDNAADAAQVLPLLPGTRNCAVLLTSRHWLGLLPGAHHLHLDAMPPSEAVDLLAAVAGRARIAAEPRAATAIVAACGLLPLAVRVAGSRLAADPGQPLAALAASLADEGTRLAELAFDHSAVEPVLALSYARLGAAQARALRLVALPDTPELPLAAAGALLDRAPEETRELLETLVDLNLLQSPAADRYGLHDLVRAFARGRSERQDAPEALTAAFARLLDFCLASARNGEGSARHVDRAGKQLTGATTTVPGLTFRGVDEANVWMLAQSALHHAVIHRVCRDPDLPAARAADLLDTMGSSLFGRGYAGSVAELAGRLADTARGRGEHAAEALARSVRASMLWHTGRFPEARAELERALPLCRARELRPLRARALHLLGSTARLERRYEDAIVALRRAVALFHELGDEGAEGLALGELAVNQAQTGRFPQARATATRGAELTGRHSCCAEALSHFYLARVLHLGGDLGPALVEAEHARGRMRRFGQTDYHVAASVLIARVHLAAGRAGAAVRAAQETLPLARQASGTLEGHALGILGEAFAALRRTDRARSCLSEALGRFRQLGHLRDAADIERTLHGLA
ncbi:BTAD domain-containing putative transcriptional regulator [Kitasatospora sp. NPDC001309]|uniref:AfsR/SARP family transcriptional regulator n=1 Tax=Kitasatospora sp. NPDC001309 TaxID=3364013 RepID=UPI0036838300